MKAGDYVVWRRYIGRIMYRGMHSSRALVDFGRCAWGVSIAECRPASPRDVARHQREHMRVSGARAFASLAYIFGQVGRAATLCAMSAQLLGGR